MRTPAREMLALCLGLALTLACAGESLGAQRLRVTSVKPLLVAAIEQGQAHGELVGDAREFMRERFKSSAAIEIDVKTVAVLDDPGCKRLEVTTRQEGIIEATRQPPVNKQLVYQVSYCRDGRFADKRSSP
jgi:hypothetical protein